MTRAFGENRQRRLEVEVADQHEGEVASVGERRPVSFSSAEEAQQLNRRVEILVEGSTDIGGTRTSIAMQLAAMIGPVQREQSGFQADERDGARGLPRTAGLLVPVGPLLNAG